LLSNGIQGGDWEWFQRELNMLWYDESELAAITASHAAFKEDRARARAEKQERLAAAKEHLAAKDQEAVNV
jgi:hypothetical protein